MSEAASVAVTAGTYATSVLMARSGATQLRSMNARRSVRASRLMMRSIFWLVAAAACRDYCRALMHGFRLALG